MNIPLHVELEYSPEAWRNIKRTPESYIVWTMEQGIKLPTVVETRATGRKGREGYVHVMAMTDPTSERWAK